MRRTGAIAFAMCLGLVSGVDGQGSRPMSPRGVASVHVLGTWMKSERQTFTMGGERYEGGRWIEIRCGRPLLRGREAFGGTGSEYGKATYAGAPVWRAGADVSTRLSTEVSLVLGGKTVAPGEYSLFIELKNPIEWTLIVSNWAAAPRFDSPISEGLFGAFGYTPDKDVVRAPMKVDALPFKVEQLTWTFVDMSDVGGRMAIMWDRSMGSVPFRFGRE